MIAQCCVIYILLLGGTWEYYDSASDPQMQQIKSKEDCQEAAARLYLRRGDIKKAYCVYLGNPLHWIVPPYDWPQPVIEYLSVPEILKRSGQQR